MNRLMTTTLAFALYSVNAAADDKADVTAAMEAWKKNLAAACGGGGPDKILPLYAEDAVLWGTISPKIRSDKAGLTDYFVGACKALPKLTVEFKEPHIRIYGGDTAINSGYYDLSYEKEGKKETLPARYSFTYVKKGDKWLIVDHHSSVMPTPAK
jgi:uncharacterized protein (TIGR02246 family)